MFNTTALSCLKLHLINHLQSFPSIVKEMYFIYKLQNHNLKGGHFYIITMHLLFLQPLGKYRKQISKIVYYFTMWSYWPFQTPELRNYKIYELSFMLWVLNYWVGKFYTHPVMRAIVVILFLYQGCQRVHVEYSAIARSRQSSTKISWPTMFYKVKKKIG